jgi:hypothetical protein
MRILFILSLTSLIRHFESVVIALADRGNHVRIVTPGRPNDWPLSDALLSHPGVSRGICPEDRSDEWNGAATRFRLLVDYARFVDGPFAQAGKLRARAFEELLAGLGARKGHHDQLGGAWLALGKTGRANMRDLLRLIEASIPSDPGREHYLETERPDIVLVTPLVGLGSEQADWVKSARALGIPVGFPVFSWDNLTTKGILHVQPDRVFVWNEIQKREAVEYHGVADDRVVVTGAPRFDAFFDLAPASDRRKFCGKIGVDPDTPIITYLCSSELVAGREVEFVARWIREIRQHPALANCSVIVRPHPRSIKQWESVDVHSWERVVLTRSRRLNADRLLYNTLYHSAAVVGLNTSAQIEAGILGKPVFTILAPGFEQGQQGTLHFRYLLAEEGGFVEVAQDFDEHRRQLAEAIDGRYDADRVRAFTEAFIRPQGLTQPATPLLASAIEGLKPERAEPSEGRSPRLMRWLMSSRG